MYRTRGTAELSMSVEVEQQRAQRRSGELGAVGQQFQRLAEQHGFEFFVLTRFPHGDRPEFSANFVMGNWPGALQAAYAAGDNFGFSRVVARLKESIVPFFSTGAIFHSETAAREMPGPAADFARHGLHSHLAFSLHDNDMFQYVIVFSGSVSDLSKESTASIYLASVELLDILSQRTRQQEGPRDKLSSRELECLRWTAAGKSSEEIAIILDISSHTVVSYLKSAMRKLDAVNRMQAVARACRFRLI